jgi:adenylate/guanylate cyclase family protein
MVEANRGQPEDKAIVFRVVLHLGDVIVEGDDIYGDDVNVAARLEAEAPPGGIVVSRAVREAVEGRLKATLQPLGDLALKSIVRPIRAFQVKWSAEDWPAYEVGTTSSAPASPLAAASKLHPPRLSIVVLPFANMGADAEQEYFVDGVTESLTTDLSRLNEMLVIGRSTAFTYKGKRVDVTQIGRELGVRYAGRFRPAWRQSTARQCAAHRNGKWLPPLGRALRKASPACSICRTKSSRGLPAN